MPAAKTLLAFLVSTGSFLGTTLLQLASASSSSGSSSSASSATTTCEGKTAACFVEQECAGCISGWGAGVTSTSDCEDRFPGVSEEQTCANQGASICCDLGDETTAQECMANRLFTEYWTCFMDGFHCSIDDIPCYDANSVASSGNSVASSAPSPSSTMELPSSAEPWGSSLSSDRDFGPSVSPTASPSAGEFGLLALEDACADVGETCTQDVICADCYSDAFEIVVDSSEGGEGYSECRSDYLEEAGSESAASAGICDVIGSAFCCSGSGCQVEGLSVAYWLCVFDFFGCSTEEAACIGGVSQSSRSDDASSAGNDIDDVGGGVVDSGELTARSDGAVGNGRRPSAVAYAYLTAAAAAGMLAVVVAPLAC